MLGPLVGGLWLAAWLERDRARRARVLLAVAAGGVAAVAGFVLLLELIVRIA